MSLAIATLEELGVEQPEQHLAVIRSFQTITLLVKENPFSPQDITAIKYFCGKRGVNVVYYLGGTTQLTLIAITCCLTRSITRLSPVSCHQIWFHGPGELTKVLSPQLSHYQPRIRDSELSGRGKNRRSAE